jgi:hypothetical protein
MAAMREAFGDGERSIVKSILAQITAGDEHRDKEVACETVANLLMANKLLYALSPDDAIWKTLARNVFPDAPKVDNESLWAQKCPSMTPANDMDYFYMMGARHRRVRLAREQLDDLDEKKKAYNEAYWSAHAKLCGWWGTRGEPRPRWHELRSDERHELKKLRRARDRMDWIRNQLDEAVEYHEDTVVHVAEANLKEWHGGPRRPPRLRRSHAVVGDGLGNWSPPFVWPHYPESSDDDDDYQSP